MFSAVAPCSRYSNATHRPFLHSGIPLSSTAMAFAHRFRLLPFVREGACEWVPSRRNRDQGVVAHNDQSLAIRRIGRSTLCPWRDQDHDVSAATMPGRAGYLWMYDVGMIGVPFFMAIQQFLANPVRLIVNAALTNPSLSLALGPITRVLPSRRSICFRYDPAHSWRGSIELPHP